MNACKKIWRPREFAALLVQNGYEYDHQTGSHSTFRNRSGRIITFPYKGNQINRMMTRRLIKEYDLTIY